MSFSLDSNLFSSDLQRKEIQGLLPLPPDSEWRCVVGRPWAVFTDKIIVRHLTDLNHGVGWSIGVKEEDLQAHRLTLVFMALVAIRACCSHGSLT